MMPRSTDAHTAKLNELLQALKDGDAASQLRVAKFTTEADERITKLFDQLNQTLDQKLRAVPGARHLAPNPVEESSDDEEDTRSLVLVK